MNIVKKKLKTSWKEFWACAHLRSKCKVCPKSRRKLRDIHNIGECFWYHNWSNGNFEIPAWPGLKNWFKLLFNKKLEKEDLDKNLEIPNLDKK